jgi:hypothetical protein
MSPVAGAFTPFSLGEKVAAAGPVFRWEKMAATPFSLGEKVAGAARQMRESQQRRRHIAGENPHPQPLSS